MISQKGCLVLLFQENTHRLTLSMSPDEQYVEKQSNAEQDKLQQKIQALSDAARIDIYEKGMNHKTRPSVTNHINTQTQTEESSQ